MRTRIAHICKCGKWVNKHFILCPNCFMKSDSPSVETENNSYNLVWEISPQNTDLRLIEGFRLLNLMDD